MKVEGIIIRITPYLEHDAIINLLTKEKLLTFKARCIFKNNHKNNVLNSLLMYGEFVFSDNQNKFLLYKDVNPIIDVRNYFGNYNLLSMYDYLSELTIRLINENDLLQIYDDLKLSLESINKIDVIRISLIYLSKIIKLNGLKINLKNINNFNYYDFINVCPVAIKNNDLTIVLNNSIKKILIDLFENNIYQLNNFKINDIKTVFEYLNLFLINYSGYTIKSYKMLLK